jgi:ABC-type tungstate transport system permease subunit
MVAADCSLLQHFHSHTTLATQMEAVIVRRVVFRAFPDRGDNSGVLLLEQQLVRAMGTTPKTDRRLFSRRSG